MDKNPYEALSEKMTPMHPGGLRLTDRAARKAGLRAGMTVLDLGCGGGDSAAHLARVYGVTAVGLDISPALTAQAAAQFPHVAFLTGDARDTGLPAGSFDAVLAECVLSVAGDLLPEINRLLRPGGLFIYSDLYNRQGEAALIARLSDAGFRTLFSEDHSPALVTYAAELRRAGADCPACGDADGYILIICQKDGPAHG